jgi:hypothetical protein
MNTLHDAAVNGDTAVVKVGPPGELPGQLSMKCLLPEEPALRTVAQGLVEGKKYAAAVTDPRSGRSRIEVDSQATSGAHTFLVVLSTAPQPPSVKLEREGGLVGVEVDGTKVLFRADGAAGGRVGNRPLPTKVVPIPK